MPSLLYLTPRKPWDVWLHFAGKEKLQMKCLQRVFLGSHFCVNSWAKRSTLGTGHCLLIKWGPLRRLSWPVVNWPHELEIPRNKSCSRDDSLGKVYSKRVSSPETIGVTASEKNGFPADFSLICDRVHVNWCSFNWLSGLPQSPKPGAECGISATMW